MTPLDILRIKRQSILSAIESLKSTFIYDDTNQLFNIISSDKALLEYWVTLNKQLNYINELLNWMETHPICRGARTEDEVWLIRSTEELLAEVHAYDN